MRATRERPEAAPIDPRVAARLAEVEEERRSEELRVRRRRAQLVLVAFGIAVGGVGLLLSPVLGAHTVDVVGAARTPQAEVVAASRLDRSDPLVRLEAGRVESRIKALPWVDLAKVERQWPRRVRITVTERSPVAVAPCGAGRCVVDATGRVLAPVVSDVAIEMAIDVSMLPLVTEVAPGGVPGSSLPAASMPALTVALALPDALKPLVREVRGAGSGVELTLRSPGRDRNPPVVRLGDAARAGDKLTAAATVLSKLGSGGLVGLDVLDVRVPEAPALTRSGRAP